MPIAKRVLLTVVSNRYLRQAEVRLLTLSGIVSAKLALDPVVKVSLARIGIDATFELHLFKRDVTALVEVFFWNRVYDMLCTLLPGDAVIDCGAGIGEFTVLAAKRVGPEGLVLAFEPKPRKFLAMQEKYRQ